MTNGIANARQVREHFSMNPDLNAKIEQADEQYEAIERYTAHHLISSSPPDREIRIRYEEWAG
jgi:hypothetical protein